MSEVGLLPLSIHSESISKTLKHMTKLTISTQSGATCTLGCPTLSLEPQPTYKEVVAVFNEDCTGLCLDCVKAGGKNEGKCRIAHD